MFTGHNEHPTKKLRTFTGQYEHTGQLPNICNPAHSIPLRFKFRGCSELTLGQRIAHAMGPGRSGVAVAVAWTTAHTLHAVLYSL